MERNGVNTKMTDIELDGLLENVGRLTTVARNVYYILDKYCEILDDYKHLQAREQPEKPDKLQHEVGWSYGLCKCGYGVDAKTNRKYCSNCGQALDWSDK